MSNFVSHVRSIQTFSFWSTGLGALAAILPRTKVVPGDLTLPAMTPAALSPFLEVSEAEWVCANNLCFAIFDSFPVSPGHVLVITRRVAPTFFECTAAEQQALMALVGEVKALLDQRLDPKPDGYNVG